MKEVQSLSLCRICLVENVRMHVVADKSLQELYEKLTDIPFVAEDNRPMLACFICYVKLKQCCQFQRQCLQAEELFAQMLNESYELYPAMYRSQLQWCGRFITTPIENISIVDDCRVENDAIKVEVPAVSETQCEAELIQLEQDPLRNESEKQHGNHQELEDSPLQHSENTEELPLIVMKFEEEEEQLTKQATSTSVAKKPELGIRKVIQEDITPAQHENNGLSDSKSILTTENRTSETVKIKDPISIMNPTVNKCIVEDSTETLNKQNIEQVTNHSTTAVDTNSCNNCDENDLMWKPTDINYDDINRGKSLFNKEKPYKCYVCQKGFAEESYLSAHIVEHTAEPERLLKCEICPKMFTTKCFLNAHIRRLHRNLKPYKCGLCQKSFSNNDHLKLHVSVHMGDNIYECGICKKSFTKLISLNTHLRDHTGEKPYKCDVCQGSFTNKTNLKIHNRIHTGVKPFKCDICQRCFKERYQLKHHYRVHTGEKPYECEVCHSRFKCYVTKNAHMVTHTGEKYHECHICHRNLSTATSLRNHIRVHTGERPYKCHICQKFYKTKQYLNLHIRKHTGEKPYKCDVCQSCFETPRAKYKHMLEHTAHTSVIRFATKKIG